MAVYFPRGQKSFVEIKAKLIDDDAGVRQNDAVGLVFVTNQEVTLKERELLAKLAKKKLELLHLERIVSILDAPPMHAVREQFLDISNSDPEKRVRSNNISQDLLFIQSITRQSAKEGSTRLFGRENAIIALGKFLNKTQGNGPAVSLISGLAGTGKTALASQMAKSVVDRGYYSENSVFVDFRGYTLDVSDAVQPSAVIPGILYALGERDMNLEPSSMLLKYHEVLDVKARSGAAVLLVFDNVSDVNQIESLLPRIGGHKVIITSRSTFEGRLSNCLAVRIGKLESTEACQMLIQLSSGQGHAHQRGEIGEFRRLARLCGELPLALQIAAAILRSDPNLSPHELAEELASEADRLESLQYHDLMVNVALTASYIRLGQEAAQLLRFSSLHPGEEISLASLSALIARRPVATRRLVRALQHAHLFEPGATVDRWRLHDLVRIYAADKLVEVEHENAINAARGRLFDYYEEMVVAAAEWRSKDANFDTRNAANEWLQHEISTVISCVHLASKMSRLATSWTLAISIGSVLSVGNNHAMRLDVSNLAVSAAEQLKDADKLASALNNVGLTENSLQRYDEAIKTFTRGLRIARTCDMPDHEIRLLTGLSESLRKRGDAELSIGPLRRAFKLIEKYGTYGHSGYVLTNIGITLRESGQPEESIPYFRNALEYHRANEDRRAEASTLGQLGTALSQTGGWLEAERLILESIKAAKDVNDAYNGAMMLINLGNLYVQQQRYEDALEQYEIALQAFQDFESFTGIYVVLMNMSKLYAKTKQFDLASDTLARARAYSSAQKTD
ncbi:tetratricopeptide repeat protein [Amycolatopsis sp. 195334CR]|uniref:tetratricopeptide repeat protein n=1 Tax=Amycolatopsis sp. 195334CR TaxID=2814588 RepID=UPI001A8FB127|nr:tetratricopeptide repeat protein [Amycolatopsis sp. 195334CR]MBN6040348.1 tetratricopeptide repeat protein [Amycolatopsis sp. 195334CR]